MGTLVDLALAALADRGEEVVLDPIAEARRHRVLAMLAQHPTTRYAVITDTESEPGVVILALAVRDVATCELRIPRDKYDGVLLLDLIERCGATVH